MTVAGVETDAAADRDGGRGIESTSAAAWLAVVGGVIGFVASFALMIEKIKLLENPVYVPSCSINPLLSCGSVMSKPQAALFGFPNPLLGVAGFAVLVTVGMALLAGARPKRWFWLGLQVGVTLAMVLVHWLFVQTLYSIGALCPYCMVVWVVTIPTFWYVTANNLATGRLPAPGPARPVAAVLVRWHGVVLTLWLLLLATLIVVQFWEQWLAML